MSGDRPTVIVGCGIGGVTAALALQAIGRPVVVLERSAQPGDSGSGITLFSNGLAGLDWIGVGAAVRAIGAPLPLDTSGLRRPDGRMLVGASAVPTTTEAYAFHRSDLHRVLRERLANGVLRTGCEVTGLRVKRDHVIVDIAGGEAVDASLLVAADGLRSPIRGALHPDYPGPRYAGYFSWRAVTPGPVALDRVAGETWGSGERFGIVPLRDGRVYWFAVANVPRESLHAELVRDDPPAEVLRRFGDWHSPIPALLAATPSEAVLPLPIYDLPTPLPRFDRGRVALLGDAAHAMTPDLGQGASQAIEDAVTLASLLTCGPPDEIAPPYKTALSRYTAERRTRTERLLKAARRTGRLAQLQSPLAVRARSALLQIVPPALSLRMVERATSWTPPPVGPCNGGHREDTVH